MEYAYTTTRGAVQVVTANIHKMIQRGVEFGHAYGKLNKGCKFVVADGKTMVPAKAKTVGKKATAKPARKAVTVKVKVAKAAKAPKVAGTPSKADLMRGQIARVKATGGTIEDCIAYGINELSQSKAQAQTYAKNNWDKV